MSASRVLIVDREESLAKVITSVLSGAGHVVMRAASGAEALAFLSSSGELDLVLTELAMPEMDGMELMRRSSDSYPDMPVIICAAANDMSVALDAIRGGAYDCLLRPFEPEQLLAVVRRALEHRRLKLESRAHQASLESLAEARTAELRQAMTDLERSYDITLEIAADLQGLKDSASSLHARRVTAFCIALSRAMGLGAEQIRVTARAAILHDIGMIAVPDGIVHKPGPLTAEETQVLREHCFRGYQVLRKIPFLREPAEVVYAHEERYDGSGFPRGLMGEAIPIGSRIFSVAHALDAILTDRPYRSAKTLGEARVEIAQLAGKQFDPEVVRAFLDVPDKVWNDLRAEVDKQFLLPS